MMAPEIRPPDDTPEGYVLPWGDSSVSHITQSPSSHCASRAIPELWVLTTSYVGNALADSMPQVSQSFHQPPLGSTLPSHLASSVGELRMLLCNPDSLKGYSGWLCDEVLVVRQESVLRLLSPGNGDRQPPKQWRRSQQARAVSTQPDQYTNIIYTKHRHLHQDDPSTLT